MLLLWGSILLAQSSEPREFEVTEGDSAYTMKRYIFCLYLTGPNRNQSEDETARIQREHLSHLSSLESTHELQVAGPFGDDTEKRGILIFDLEQSEQAEEAMALDPAVKAGRLTYECHPWWAAKGSTLK